MSFDVVAGIVTRGARVLLVRSKKHGQAVTPGGRVEDGETHAQALVREFREETGLPVTQVGRLLGTETKADYTVHVYEVEVDGRNEPVAGSDAEAAWWGDPREVRDSSIPRDYVWILEVMVRRFESLRSIAALRPLADPLSEVDFVAIRTRWAFGPSNLQPDADALIGEVFRLRREDYALRAALTEGHDELRGLPLSEAFRQRLEANRKELARKTDRLQRACAEGLPRELILCPQCSKKHVDGTNGPEFATSPHHTHLCQYCGHQWDHKRWSFGADVEDNLVSREEAETLLAGVAPEPRDPDAGVPIEQVEAVARLRAELMRLARTVVALRSGRQR